MLSCHLSWPWFHHTLWKYLSKLTELYMLNELCKLVYDNELLVCEGLDGFIQLAHIVLSGPYMIWDCFSTALHDLILCTCWFHVNGWPHLRNSKMLISWEWVTTKMLIWLGEKAERNVDFTKLLRSGFCLLVPEVWNTANRADLK